METITDLIERFKGIVYGETKNDVEGHHIMTDDKNKRTLLMIKEGEYYWKTKWVDTNETIFKTPKQSLTSIFTN